MELFDYQLEGLKRCEGRDRVAFYWDMGTGKTFVGAEKMMSLGKKVNLVVCQKSKIQDWIDHFSQYYRDESNPFALSIWDLTTKGGMMGFLSGLSGIEDRIIGVINYELTWRRKDLLKLKDFTLMLDESSLIQNEHAKQTKFIMKLNYDGLILLSGTPVGGKYERLWSQLHMLGWPISRDTFWSTYIDYEWDRSQGFPICTVYGYKRVDRLKSKLAQYGCQFLRTDEVLTLPEQRFQTIKVKKSKEYIRFKKDSVVEVMGKKLVGDHQLTKLLYLRQLCGWYSKDKMFAFLDLVEATTDRLIVFYNFTGELDVLRYFVELRFPDRPISIINGKIKDKSAYEQYEDSITFVQYQAGAMGINLQKANKIIYYTPTLTSELYEQSKKRTHRVGQTRSCIYYKLIVKGSVEEKIYRSLDLRQDYTEELFRKDEEDGIF